MAENEGNLASYNNVQNNFIKYTQSLKTNKVYFAKSTGTRNHSEKNGKRKISEEKGGKAKKLKPNKYISKWKNFNKGKHFKFKKWPRRRGGNNRNKDKNDKGEKNVKIYKSDEPTEQYSNSEEGSTKSSYSTNFSNYENQKRVSPVESHKSIRAQNIDYEELRKKLIYKTLLYIKKQEKKNAMIKDETISQPKMCPYEFDKNRCLKEKHTDFLKKGTDEARKKKLMCELHEKLKEEKVKKISAAATFYGENKRKPHLSRKEIARRDAERAKPKTCVKEFDENECVCPKQDNWLKKGSNIRCVQVSPPPTNQKRPKERTGNASESDTRILPPELTEEKKVQPKKRKTCTEKCKTAFDNLKDCCRGRKTSNTTTTKTKEKRQDVMVQTSMASMHIFHTNPIYIASGKKSKKLSKLINYN